MPIDMTLIQEAELRGYLEFNPDRTRITYLCSRRYTDDFTDPEEQVRAFIYAWLIIRKGYPASRIDIELTVPRRTPADRADIVVFEDDRLTGPYLVVEAKEEQSTQGEWNQAIEQGFGNANSLRTTKYLLVDKADRSNLYDIQNHPPTERTLNLLGVREALAENYGVALQFRLTAGGPDDISAADPTTVENAVRRAHGAIWAGGKRDPLTAFDEWSKLLFAKIWDERHTPNGQPRQFQVSANESPAQTAGRIRARFAEARRGDPSIFAADAILLPDEKIVEVARLIQEIGFTLCDIDALGAAFEHFFGSVFRGDLGQYFTQRELVRFILGALRPRDTDFVLDPTAGSGGFLLETLIQVWRYIDTNYAGQPDAERRKLDFALNHLFGIEIHATLGRVCKTNLLIHKDGHTNIEVERTCLDSHFSNPNLRPDGSIFTLVVGNPPFGDTVSSGDTDRLGTASLSDFELAADLTQISSELIIIERALQFLVPGGRLGMVVPDGALNNSGENSRCPMFRRFLLTNSRVEMVVSLPDFAFRKAGAQNKTSLLFLRKFTTEEKRQFDTQYAAALQRLPASDPPTPEEQQEAIYQLLLANPYRVFFAEVDHIGYSPTGVQVPQNQLYTRSPQGDFDLQPASNVLSQFNVFSHDPHHYPGIQSPSCNSMLVTDALRAHTSFRLDPKFHLFQLERIRTPPAHMSEFALGDLLTRREEVVHPQNFPDREFLTLTLSQDGTLSPREAGKGNNPPSWHGVYFTDGSRWYAAHEGDVIVSQIDLWKGCVAVIPPQYAGAIVTQEFPVYEVDTTRLDPRYLALLLRSAYFRRAVRAITTGHSNRRRTQQEDFEALRIFLPGIATQRRIAAMVLVHEGQVAASNAAFATLLENVEDVILGRLDPDRL